MSLPSSSSALLGAVMVLSLWGCTGNDEGRERAQPGGDFIPTAGSADKDQGEALRALERETGVRWLASFGVEGTPNFLSGRTAPLIGGPRASDDAPVAALAFIEAHKAIFRMGSAHAELAPAPAQVDAYGNIHVRLAQVISGVPVHGGDLSVQFDPDGALTAIAGRYLADLLHLDVRASLGPANAGDRAVARLRASRPTLVASSIEVPEARLMIYAPEQGTPALAYRVKVRAPSAGTPIYREIFVDANSGAVLDDFDLIHTVAGSGKGVLGDTKSFDVTWTGSRYEMSSKAINPNGISVYTAKGQETQPGTIVSSTNVNSWDTGVFGAGAAVDAFVYQGLSYRYYKDVLGRLGIDGNNMRQINTVHYGNKYNNAYWDGTQMVFGDGDGELFTSLAGALDVVAHELTHGVTEHTSGLVYRYQPGALNEANSDIMGAFVEHWAHGQGNARAANWLIGEDCTPAGSPLYPALRDMAHPSKGDQPDHMSKFVNTLEDNGGVHINSGIINNAAYLFTQGGTNDTSGKSVSGLGRERAEKLYFHAASHCYTSNTSFVQAAQCVVKSAETLHGQGSCEAQTVKNAFIATGVLSGNIVPCGGECVPVCSGKVCGASNGCGGVCEPGSGCNSNQPSGEVEPNNARTSATQLPKNGSLSGQVSSVSDVDYFRISVTPWSFVRVTLDGLDADCDLSLYNSQGTLLGTSENWDQEDEELSGQVGNVTVLYARVYGYNGAICRYRLSQSAQ
jgi:Zn-dependent metalloprotease